MKSYLTKSARFRLLEIINNFYLLRQHKHKSFYGFGHLNYIMPKKMHARK